MSGPHRTYAAHDRFEAQRDALFGTDVVPAAADHPMVLASAALLRAQDIVGRASNKQQRRAAQQQLQRAMEGYQAALRGAAPVDAPEADSFVGMVAVAVTQHRMGVSA